MTYEFDALVQVRFSNHGVGIRVGLNNTLYYNLLTRREEGAQAPFRCGDSYRSTEMVKRQLVHMGMNSQDVCKYLNEILVIAGWDRIPTREAHSG